MSSGRRSVQEKDRMQEEPLWGGGKSQRTQTSDKGNGTERNPGGPQGGGEPTKQQRGGGWGKGKKTEAKRFGKSTKLDRAIQRGEGTSRGDTREAWPGATL